MSPKESLSGVFLVADFDATELFQDDEMWQYAVEHARFQHSEACEFMFYVGGDREEFLDLLKDHSNNNCPQELIDHLKYARHLGAKWALFYA